MTDTAPPRTPAWNGPGGKWVTLFLMVAMLFGAIGALTYLVVIAL